MDTQFWLEKWESRQIGFHLDTVHPLLERHWPPAGVREAGTALVPLCGKSLDLIYLHRLGHDVVGVELSPLAIREFFAEHGLQPAVRSIGGMEAYEAEGICLIQGDFFALRREHLPDIGAVYDRASLIAFPPDRQPRYAEQLMMLAPDAAPILLITLEYDNREMQGPPFSTPADRVERLFGRRYRIERLESGDALAGNPGLQARGLTAMTETAWSLQPRPRA
jgi:thiopurine S-methyltransferase